MFAQQHFNIRQNKFETCSTIHLHITMCLHDFSLYRTYCAAQRTQCYQGKCEKHNNTNNCSSETEKKSPKESRTPKQKQQLYQHRPQIAGKVSAISALGRWPRYRGLSPQRGDCERQNKTTWRKQTKTHKKNKKTKKQIKTHDIF